MTEQADWSGKAVLVSGGARGQGLSHALAFARRGADVVLLDAPAPLATVPYPVSTEEELEAARVTVSEAGGTEVLAYAADVRDPEAVRVAIDHAASRLGGIDVTIANAGVFSFARTTWELSPQEWRECSDTILLGSWAVARAAIPHMLGRAGANLVFIGSVSAHKGIAATGHYVAAKHGVVGLMRTLAVELAPHGIRANMVSPTAARTLMATNPAMAKCVEYQVAGGTNMSNLLDVELLEPEDVTEAVLWITSPGARYVTGDVLKVDAGFTAR
ncbi:mycofactocin-coupled SDR family oxidoreductase [Nocardioides agariphilus]|uniref:Mycofactocin-coupled SDR family oxidoreductase n=1 Tax=Nocardioides agariphilus TaxID=433664 RepID=A0A930VKS9_9ACTN|nr:SDR family oxidoreductase [Nocardioides agariphilus]MBF4769359.1 mycofactocin-coupled SDR family oxidoreductase [Nocardioides agariphilus]